MRTTSTALFVFLTTLGLTAGAFADEAGGTILEVRGTEIKIQPDLEFLSGKGDRIEIYVEVPAVGTAVVGTAIVTAVDGQQVLARIERSTGKIKTGQRVRALGDGAAASMEQDMPPGGPASGDSALPVPNLAASDFDRFQGRWRNERTIVGGKASEAFVGVEAIFDGHQLTWLFPGLTGKPNAQEGTFELDSTQTPKHFDWTPRVADHSKGPEIRIYAFEGDTLKMGTNMDYRTRPATLEEAKLQFELKRFPPSDPKAPPGAPRDEVEEFRRNLDAARRGDAQAQYNVGKMYVRGTGVVPAAIEAVHWYRKAADQGHAEAMSALGVMYWTGQGVVPKDMESVRLHQVAAERGVPQSIYAMGIIYESSRGLPRDDQKAALWYRRAAEEGYTLAQYKLGQMYKQGRGVPQSDVEAVNWYRKAAEAGNPQAQLNVGLAFYKGRGVAQSDREAYHWFLKSGKQGYPNAQYNVGIMISEGRGVRRDDKMAIQWFRAAADQGLAIAQHRVGWMYESGTGVRKDVSKAIHWYRKASDQGHEPAKQFLRNLGVEP
jgi:uncharacterized protein (TIGR03067 family)